MRQTIFLFSVLYVCIIGIVCTLAYLNTENTPKNDYYLNIDQSDSFYLLDRKGDTIYVEKFNDIHPTKLQTAINLDNL